MPDGGKSVGSLDVAALWWALVGALAGGILLNLMPCVFPILALKASHLARAGGDEREARHDALAYAAGAVVGTGALGIALLAIRAGGSAAGWAFQLQDPRTVLLLLLLVTAITLNLLRVYELPVLGGSARPAGSFATGALAAFVATPCAGPFLGAALGTALLLPASGSIIVFAMLGLGLALPFLAVAFIPALRHRLPKPGPWMARLQRFLAFPMGVTAVGCLWLLWRSGGVGAVVVGTASVVALGALLFVAGGLQRRSRPAGLLTAALATLVVVTAVTKLPAPSASSTRAVNGAERWSPDTVTAYVRQGKPVFVYFTADWCLTCKANEAATIDRDAVRAAFKQAGVKVVAGDWTNGDPRSRASLKAVAARACHFTFGTIRQGRWRNCRKSLHRRCLSTALARRAVSRLLPGFLAATQVSKTCVRPSDGASTFVGSRSTMMKSAHLPGARPPIRSSAKPA